MNLAKHAHARLEHLARSYREDRDFYRFQVFAAAYAWLTLWHSGGGSPEYELLCMIPFNPGPCWSEARELDPEHNYESLAVVELLESIFGIRREEVTES